MPYHRRRYNPPSPAAAAAYSITTPSQFMSLIETNDRDAIETIIYYQPDWDWVSVPDALDTAINHGYTDLAELLLKSGWNLEWDYDRNHLMTAVDRGDIRLIKLLQKYGWDATWNPEALQVAIAKHGFDVAIPILLSGSQDDFSNRGDEAIREAINLNNIDGVDILKNMKAQGWILPSNEDIDIYEGLWDNPNPEILRVLVEPMGSDRWWTDSYSQMGIYQLVELAEEETDPERLNDYHAMIQILFESALYPEDDAAISEIITDFPNYLEFLNSN